MASVIRCFIPTLGVARTTQAELVLFVKVLISADGIKGKSGTLHPGLVLNIIAVLLLSYAFRRSCQQQYLVLQGVWPEALMREKNVFLQFCPNRALYFGNENNSCGLYRTARIATQANIYNLADHTGELCHYLLIVVLNDKIWLPVMPFDLGKILILPG